MRKIKTGLSMILVIALMLITVTGCDGGSSEADLEGTWNATVDMSGIINDGIAEADEEMAEYFNISDFTITLYYTFNSDGTYTMTVDEDTAATAMESLKNDIGEGLSGYMEALFAEQDLGMTVDEILELSGMTMDDLLDEMMEESDFESLVDELNVSGNWKVDGNKLYTTDSEDEEFDDDSYETFTLSSNTLVLTGENADEEYASLYPVTLTKEK